MMLAAPELVIAEIVELLHEIEVAAELQHRMLAERMMRGEKGSEFEALHRCFLVPCLLFFAHALVSYLPISFNVGACGAAMHFPGNAKSDA